MATKWTVLSAVVLAAALMFHAAFPRYQVEVHPGGLFRIDRWTGSVEAAQRVGQVSWATAAR